MSDQAAGVLVTVDVVIPRLSPSGSGWEVLLIQRNKQPYQGMWAHCLTEESYFERGECLMGNLTFTEFSLTH